MRCLIVVALGALLMTGCSSSSGLAPATLPLQDHPGTTGGATSSSGLMSAVRAPASVLAAMNAAPTGQRQTEGLSAVPWPLTAVPWPLNRRSVAANRRSLAGRSTATCGRRLRP
ncbi:MAG: hypothetical protein M3R44_05265 [Candidatus Eremiobacteraeota bacterium]|nr:hypothetical protein [Candidatus Eremiobacteraeota bacterium]